MKMLKKVLYFFIILFLIMYFFSYQLILESNAKTVSNSSDEKVYIVGKNIGLKLYTNGILVIGMSEIEGDDGNKYKPYDNTGIEIGDLIKEVNGESVNNTNELINILNNNGENEIEVKYLKNYDLITTKIKPVKTELGYMIGLWVRDAASGIGTLTYYNESNNRFGALGHGIEDVDTGNLLNIAKGELVTSNIVSIVKAKKGIHGEVRGTIEDGKLIGEIDKNTEIGVYGNCDNEIKRLGLFECEVANINQIKIGKADIYCEFENGKVDKYEIEIRKIFRANKKDNKSMLIKITDKRLLEKTGGIIPGMSGTPIVQNGKFIGAITNVLVNKPDEGYAIFAKLMTEN